MLRNFLPVLHILSILLICLAVTMCLPLIVSALLHEGLNHIYITSIISTLLIAVMIFVFTRKYKRNLHANHAILLVCSIWILIPLFATIPFYSVLYNQHIYLSLSQTYFEIVSCFTTTGASVFTEFNQLPISINFWRSFLQWLGGMGITLLAVAVLPLIGASGKQLYRVETAGPIKDNSITPRISQMAKGLWLIYLSMSILCAFLYWLSGLAPLESIMLMFTTISLGGASFHDASFFHYDSIFAESVAIVFMLIASCNFALYFNILRTGKLNVLKNNIEAKATITVLITCSLFVSIYLYFMGSDLGGYDSFFESLRFGGFNSISIATTTGFSTSNYSKWPIFAALLPIILSGIVCSAGSTGGGIKMMRIVLLFKQSKSEFIKLIHPNAVRPVTINGVIIKSRIIFSIAVFIFFYIVSVLLLSLILMASNLDALTSFSAVLASINNMGTGLRLVAPENNFALLNDFQLAVCSFAMLLGRLEIISLLVLFTPAFWRK